MTDLHSAHAPELIFDTHVEHFDRAEIEAVLGVPLAGPSGDAPRSPGALPSHYAPRTPLVLVPLEDLQVEVARRLENGEHVAVLSRFAATTPANCIWQVMPADPGGYAHELYARLHALDALHADRLLIEAPPPDAPWEAVRDRLARAAQAGLDPKAVRA